VVKALATGKYPPWLIGASSIKGFMNRVRMVKFNCTDPKCAKFATHVQNESHKMCRGCRGKLDDYSIF
jgi:hypothetical protein